MPISTVAFGLFSLATGFVKSFGAAIPVRILLGIAEAGKSPPSEVQLHLRRCTGVFPGFAYYLSRWYTKAELPFVMSIYIIGTPLALVDLMHDLMFIADHHAAAVLAACVRLLLKVKILAESLAVASAIFLLPPLPGYFNWCNLFLIVRSTSDYLEMPWLTAVANQEGALTMLVGSKECTSAAERVLMDPVGIQSQHGSS